MLRDYLPWEEQDALKKILLHHGIDDEELIKALATFVNWVHADEQVKFGQRQPPFLLVLLSQLGVLTPRKPDHGPLVASK